MVIWSMNLQMHDKLYAGFVGCTEQDQKLGMNPTFTYFDIYVLLKAQNQKLWNCNIVESKDKVEKSVNVKLYNQEWNQVKFL